MRVYYPLKGTFDVVGGEFEGQLVVPPVGVQIVRDGAGLDGLGREDARGVGVDDDVGVGPAAHPHDPRVHLGEVLALEVGELEHQEGFAPWHVATGQARYGKGQRV